MNSVRTTALTAISTHGVSPDRWTSGSSVDEMTSIARNFARFIAIPAMIGGAAHGPAYIAHLTGEDQA